MSSLMRPSGPEPSGVYWIRRGAAVLVVITILALLWWLLGSMRGGGSSEPEAAVSATPSASASAAVPSVSPSPTAPAEPTGCANASIKVEAGTDASTYVIGETPKLTVTITNVGTVACTRDVGPKANELEITSGGYHVWSSDDCSANGKSKVVTLKPDDTYAASITWDGRISQKGCPDGDKGPKAKAGRYDVTGRNGKVTSEATAFALSNKN